jgi:hypothetical protein
MKDLSVCEENYEYLKELLNDKRNRINAAYVLQDRYIPEKAQELFTLFSASDDSYIRRIAADIGKECGIDLTEFFAEMDRRSKTTLENSECKIAFLAKYTEKYHVDISDNGESAVIYNPVGEEHILFSYCGDEYTISFSFIIFNSCYYFHCSVLLFLQNLQLTLCIIPPELLIRYS